MSRDRRTDRSASLQVRGERRAHIAVGTEQPRAYPRTEGPSKARAWMNAERLVHAEDLWEHYVTGPHSNPDPTTWRTELYRPVRG